MLLMRSRSGAACAAQALGSSAVAGRAVVGRAARGFGWINIGGGGRGELSTLPDVAASSAHYDLLVVGSGPAAIKCAVTSAKLGKQVAVVDKKGLLGGVCVHTGTIPSKTFREAVLHLTGYRHQGFYGRSYGRSKSISMPDLLSRVRKVERAETDVVTDQLSREGVEIITGTARFIEGEPGDSKVSAMVLRSTKSSHEADSSPYRHVEADTPKSVISADRVLVACGTRPVRPSHIPFDGEYIFDSDQLLWGGIKHIPRDLIVVGAGVIGMEYACMINVIPGTTVTVLDPRPDVLPFADNDVIENLQYSMRQNGARFLLKERITKVEKLERKGGGGPKVVAHLESGKRVVGDAMLYTMGRQGNTDSMDLGKVGMEADGRGLIKVNDFYQSSNPRVYGCGDVIGYPALASTSMEQGRRAAMHMWGQRPRLDDDNDDANDEGRSIEAEGHSEHERERVKSDGEGGFLGRDSEQLFPYGIYTIPEVSMIGKTEAQLTAEGVSYEVGIADYQELAKGQMLGGADGFLKLIFHTETLKLLGVHCIGDGATEIIHIGQVVMSQGGSIEYFQTAVFNFPTMAEAYNVAAADGLRKVESVEAY